MQKLRHYFVAGLMIVVPLFLTVYVMVILFRFADNLLGRFINVFFRDRVGFYIPGAGILFSIIVILLIGFLAKRLFIFNFLDKGFKNFPLIRSIYPTFKQMISFFLAQKDLGFKKVVLVEYPSKGIWSLGFLTNEDGANFSQILKKEIATVFMPTSPSPFTGFVIFVPKEDIKVPDISIPEAFKIIISGGVYKR